MLAQKEPVIKLNKNQMQTRACSICGFEIDDEFCAKTNRVECPECAGEICFKDRKHKVIFKFDKPYCTVCNNFVKDQESYQRWINHKLPDCRVEIERA